MERSVDLTNYSEAARMFEVHRVTISDLAKKHSLIPKRPKGVSGSYNGLDKDDLVVIKQALGMTSISA